MRALYVDTGIWPALLDSADPLHDRARSILEANRTYPFYSSEQVLSENVTLVRRELGPEPAASFGRDFVAGRIGTLVRCEMTDWNEAFGIIQKYWNQKISAADATSVAVIRRLDIEKVASFDKHFKIVLTEREVVDGA